MNSIWTKDALLKDGWRENVRFSIKDDKISNIEIGVPKNTGDEIASVIMPGIGNVHSHAFQRGMAGLSEQKSSEQSDNFWSWREIMYHFLDRLSPDDVRIISKMAYMEMLESGFTQVGEFHYLHHDVDGIKYQNIAQMAEEIIAASDETGINITLLPVFYAHSNFGAKAPNSGQRRFINNIDDYFELFAKCQDLIKGQNRIGIAPHSLRAVTRDELEKLIDFAPTGPIHIHAAEQEKEVNDCIDYYNKRPIEWLLNNFEIDERWCLIHSTHINDAEIAGLAKSGAVAGLCPITEANLGDGIFPADKFLANNGRIGIGTDSNILIDLARELSSLEYSMRLINRQRNVLSSGKHNSIGRNLFELGWSGGAQALDFKANIEICGPATFVELALDDFGEDLINKDLSLDKWIFASRRNSIKSVWVNGKKLVADGRHLKSEKIREDYKRTIGSIIKEF